MILFSCKDENKASFTISGTIKDGKGKQLVLNKFTADKTLKLDTVTIDDANKFSFSGNTAAPELFSLELLGDNKGQILLIVDSLENITVNGDVNDLFF